MMTYHTNYMTVNKSSYTLQNSDGEPTETGLKEKAVSLIYPAIGVMGLAYQIYLLLTR